MKYSFSKIFLAAIFLFSSACSSTEQTRYREGSNEGQVTSMTVDDERRLTQEVLPQMKKDYPPLNHPEMQAYITKLGRTLAAKSNLEGNPYNYTFTVVDVPSVNAFALPAGTTFVTVPLIAMSDSEAELSAVIGHELGHVIARHTAERMEKAKREQSKSWKYAVGGGLLGGILGYGLGRVGCPKGDNACIRKATETGLGVGGVGGMLVQKYGFMQNSQQDELEADRIGFRMAMKADYDKSHVGRFYEKLLAMEKSRGAASNGVLKSINDALSTHPPSQDRINQMREMAAQERKTGGTVSSPEFLKMKQEAQRIMNSKPKKAG